MAFISKPVISDHSVTFSLSSKRELYVSELVPNNETPKKIGTVVREWQMIAYHKKMEADSFLSEMIFHDLARIARLIAECMQSPEETTSIWNQIFICEDVALKEIQAIALVRLFDVELKLSHIVTHPRNVRSKVNQNETMRVEGAASAIIHHLETTLPPSCKKIYLESVVSARLFYQKLGFEELDPRKYSPDEVGTIPMVLTAKKIKSLNQKVS